LFIGSIIFSWEKEHKNVKKVFLKFFFHSKGESVGKKEGGGKS